MATGLVTTEIRRAPTGAWKPGQSGNPGGRQPRFHVVRALARMYSTEAVEKLHELMISPSSEPGIQLTAAVAILDRAFGKPGPAPAEPEAKDAPGRDYSRLSLEQMRELVRLQELATVPSGPASGATTEGEIVPTEPEAGRE